jgi:hypothetical protein
VIEYVDMEKYFEHMGAEKWYKENIKDVDFDEMDDHNAEIMSEIYSRSCYKSFGVGLGEWRIVNRKV